MRKRVQASSTNARSVKKAKTKAIAPRFKTLSANTYSGRPQSIRTTCFYHEQGVTINPGVGTAAAYIFAANGLYDPNITGTGHQPLGFDQYMALYGEYLVVGSTIKVTFANSSTTVPAYIGVFLEDLTTTDTSFSRYVENGNGVYSVADVANSGMGIKTLTHKADIRKFSHQDIFAEDNFSGTASANPNDTHYFHVVVAPFDAATDMSACYISVEIRYDVIFRDPILTAFS